MRRLGPFLAALTLLAFPVAAQQTRPTPGLEARWFSGVFFPMAAQSRDFQGGSILGAQIAQEFTDHFHALASVAWTNSRDKFPGVDDDRIFIWQYDLGVEANALVGLRGGWLFRPLLGIGFGGRTYEYLATGLASSRCSTGYGTVGSEFQRGLLAVRVDARDYVSCYKSPVESARSTRNDVTLTVGLVFHVR
jgi:hypothetical protein